MYFRVRCKPLKCIKLDNHLFSYFMCIMVPDKLEKSSVRLRYV